MNDNKKSYYAIIPANVRYDKRLNANAKLLFGEITALCNEKGYCWASNSYFAELYEVSTTSISTWIKRLKECGYIETKVIYKDGSKEILHRYISILTDPTQENLKTPTQENLKDNNTVINNTINTTKEDKRKRFTPPSREEIETFTNENQCHIDIDNFIDYYNSNGWKVGSNKMSDWKATVRNWHRRDKKNVKVNKPAMQDNLKRFEEMDREYDERNK